MNFPGDLNDHPRVSALIEQFGVVDAGMRDLPIYNHTVAIESVGFRLFNDVELLGVVLTPWFMNLLILPITPVAMNMAEIGRTVSVELPIGARPFVVGGNEAVGLYKAHSLHSPVLSFTLPGQARAEAHRQLALLMTSVAAEPVARPASDVAGLDRRALLFRRRNI
ncbi:MAG: [NiFe]-hydrogenase assembly chaperone HybE [Acidocella sp.]|uniref:[NiFe]-hydrogenase assembly chaperone HybE n=1 Tax=Acidocella sp. TaxID=50710 RepID=UPI003FD72F3B